MPTWYVLLDGPQEDLVHVKRLFTASGFTFDRMDDKDALSAPAFESCKDTNEVIDSGVELLASINTALRISLFQYTGFQFHGIVEKRENGTVHRTMLAQGAAYDISGATAVLSDGSIGKPVRSKEERLVSLMARKEEIADLAIAMGVRPLTWGAMNTIYESVKGLMSTMSNPDAKRSDYQGLIDRGWITSEESARFYKTAAYHRHGYPKSPNRAETPMGYGAAYKLTNRLFWLLVDELEPS